MVCGYRSDIFELGSEELVFYIRNQFTEIRKNALKVVNKAISDMCSEEVCDSQCVSRSAIKKEDNDLSNGEGNISDLLSYLRDSNNRLSKYDIRNI